MLAFAPTTPPESGKRTIMPESAPKRLSICMLSYRSNPHSGGQGVYVKNLSAALCDLGHRVEVISGPPYMEFDPRVAVTRPPVLDFYDPAEPFRAPRLEELRDPINWLQWAGVSAMGFPEPFTFGLRARSILRQGPRRFDLVHDNQHLSYGLLSIARRYPVVATIHHPITVDRRLAVAAAANTWQRFKQKRWYSFVNMQMRVARRLSPLVTVSRASLADISREYRLPEKRFRVVPNGVDTGLFRPLGLPRFLGNVICTTSSDTPLKGLPVLLSALALLPRELGASLTVVGSPKKGGRVENMVRELGLAGRVKFTGRVSNDELVERLNRAAVAVAPSLYEGFGLPALEAMACGTPLVASMGGALPEVVGEAGLLVPAGDSAGLALALAQVLSRPALAGELARRGLARVAGRYTWDAAARQMVDVYREAIRAHRGL